MKHIYILDSFEKILNKVKVTSDNYKLYNLFSPSVDEVKDDIEKLSLIYGTSDRQILILTIMLDLCGYGTVDISQLPKALKCSFFTFLSLKKDIEFLKTKNLLEGTQQISVPRELIESIEKDVAYRIPISTGLSTKRMLEKLCEISNQVISKKKSPIFLLRMMDGMIMCNPGTSLAMACDRYGIMSFRSIPTTFIDYNGEEECLQDSYTEALDSDERMLFYALLYYSITKDAQKISIETLKDFFSEGQIISLKNKISDSTINELFSILSENEETIVSIPSNLLIQVFYDMEPFASKENKSHKEDDETNNIISFENIKIRNMFYPEKVKNEIDILTRLLSEEKFAEIRNSMTGHGLRSGFTCLFYGYPGTGKTESAYQIAKHTGRDILSVNCSSIRGAYVGESEKNIKKLFDDYRTYSSTKKICPILLFNEADAVLGMRSEHVDRPLERMENSIQNIILQEMEQLEGIMIATTNMLINLDKAFDRRFLYKICFSKPDTDTLCQIWHNMIPELSDAEILYLSREFQLTGGQIENICRKKMIKSILETNVSFNSIIELCKEELNCRNPHQSHEIGFKL